MQRQIGVARSAFLPNIYTGTGVAYTSGFPLLEGGGAPAIFTLSYTQQIFNPPLKGEQHAAEQRAEEQRLSMDDVRDTVMSRAALDYLELAKVRHALELMHSERTERGTDSGSDAGARRYRARASHRSDSGAADHGANRAANRANGRPRRFPVGRASRHDGHAAGRDDRGLHRGNSRSGRGSLEGRRFGSHGQQRGAETGANRIARPRIQTERRTGRPLAIVRPDRPVQRAEQDQQLHRFF